MTAAAIDGCVFHDWSSTAQLLPYLSDTWRELLERPGDLGGPLQPTSSWIHTEPSREGTPPRRTWTYRDCETLRSGLLDSGERDRVVLGSFQNLLITASPHHYIASSLVSATNDWTVAEWLDRDERLYGMVLVYAALPEVAAAEIRRFADEDRMVAVALGANGLSNLFGHPVYHPIYAAAAEAGLPVVLQVGSDSAVDLAGEPVAGGLPTTYGEYRALSVQPIMTHLASMITEGVFEKFPTLKVLALGGGLTWVGPYLWRLDYWYKTLEREAPWLTRLPSAYFTDHVRLSTYSMETVPTAEQLARALSAVPEMEQLILYASGAPSTDALPLDQTLARLPSRWHRRILNESADELFRWPRPPARDGAAARRPVESGASR